MGNYGVDFDWIKGLLGGWGAEGGDVFSDGEKVGTFGKLEKRGFMASFSWELLAERKGRSIPVGVRWWQHLGYLLFVPLFYFSQWLNGRVERSRHVWGAGGYDYEPAELKQFSQKTRWVDDGSD